jgi:hypothetical protein
MIILGVVRCCELFFTLTGSSKKYKAKFYGRKYSYWYFIYRSFGVPGRACKEELSGKR